MKIDGLRSSVKTGQFKYLCQCGNTEYVSR